MTATEPNDFDDSFIVSSDHPNAEALQRKIDAAAVIAPWLPLVLQRWDDAESAGRAMAEGLREQITGMREQRAEHIRRVGYLQRHLVAGQRTAEIDAEIASEQAKADALANKIKLKEAAAAKAMVKTPLQPVLKAIGSTLGDFDLAASVLAAKVPKGSTAAAEVVAIVAKAANREAAVTALRATSPSLEEIRAAADKEIDRARDASGEPPNIHGLFNYRDRNNGSVRGFPNEKPVFALGGIKWPTFRLFDGIDFKDAPNTNAMFRHIFDAEIRAWVHAQIDAKFDASKALPIAERDRQIAALQAEIEELWYQAGALAMLAESNGEAITYPPNMPPLAIVGLVELPPAPKAAPGRGSQLLDGAPNPRDRVI